MAFVDNQGVVRTVSAVIWENSSVMPDGSPGGMTTPPGPGATVRGDWVYLYDATSVQITTSCDQSLRAILELSMDKTFVDSGPAFNFPANQLGPGSTGARSAWVRAAITNTGTGDISRWRVQTVLSPNNVEPGSSRVNTGISATAVAQTIKAVSGGFKADGTTTYQQYDPAGNLMVSMAGVSAIKGDRGASVLSGQGPPPADLGMVGDGYIDYASPTVDLYGKGATGWGPPLPLKGPPGTNGTNGTNGVQGPPGVVVATAPLTYNPLTQTVGLAPNPSAEITITGTTMTAVKLVGVTALRVSAGRYRFTFQSAQPDTNYRPIPTVTVPTTGGVFTSAIRAGKTTGQFEVLTFSSLIAGALPVAADPPGLSVDVFRY